MKKIEDIIASLKRARNTRYDLTVLTDLAEFYRNIDNCNLLEYVPIKIISCFEEYFRQMYKEIIDTPMYRKNLKNVKFLKELRMDFDVINAFQNNLVTLGDYLSYYFSCSSVDQVFNQLEQILEVKIKDELINKLVDIEKQNSVSIKEARKKVLLYIDSVEGIFKARHILCHEGTFGYKIDNPMAMQMIDDAILFIRILDELISNILYPCCENYTQAAMNSDAIAAFNKADEELEKIVKNIKIKDEQDDFAHDFSYLDAWEKFRICKAESDAKICEGGSMYPCVYYMSLEYTTRQFILQLKREFRLFDE